MTLNRDFVEACKSGDLLTAKECVEQGADIHIYTDFSFRWAAWKGHLAIVKYLIEQGANIHTYEDEALRWAAEEGHLQIVNVIRKAAGDEYKCHRCIIRSICLELCDDLRQP